MFELHGSLYTLKISHLIYLIVISDNISLFKLILFYTGLQIRPFLTYSINPHHFCIYPIMFEFHIDDL